MNCALLPSDHQVGISHQYQDLILLFEHTFFQTFNTKLVKGDDEPLYLPASNACAHHRIIFAHGYFASALHEISHWCIAGPERRLKEDFGYWYLPDGRNEQQQAKFEHVEIKPQAVEWALSVACQKPFNVSVDNLQGTAEPDRAAFQAKVLQQVAHYLTTGFPQQAQTFIETLATHYGTPLPLTLAMFKTAKPTNQTCDIEYE